MKDSAEIVVIGGGAVGCSIAYHLAQLGKRDVVVLEKSGLTQGSTWHAAGLIGQLRGKRNLTRMLQYSVELYDRLETETGQATDWKKVGSLRVASSKARWREIKRTASTARSFGFELQLVTAAEARDLFPLMSIDGVEGAAYIPSDGYVDPSSLTQALAKGARTGGVSFHEGVRVTGFRTAGRRVTHVLTDHGDIRTERVVNAAGMWARQIGAMAGLSLPAGVIEHQYLVTEKAADLPAGLPTFRDPDNNFYLKPEVGGIAVGGWEFDAVPFGEDGVPFEFGRELLPSNYERFESIAVPAAERVPILGEIGVRNLINGPIPVSVDGEPIMGLAPELDNYYVACGFTAGIAGCGGAGRAMAQWIVDGDPGMDLWAFDVRRFGPHHNSRRYLRERTIEAYGAYYLLHPPGEEAHSARGARRSPLYDVLSEHRAVYGSKFGWERPNWFAPDGVEALERPSFDRPNWFEPVAAEHRAVRERVALIDMSSFSKFEIDGPGALRCLQWLASNDLDKPVGAVTYTQLCNRRGGIEADVTITRLAEDRFYLITGSGFATHDGAWIRAHLPADGSVHLRDVSSARAVINVCGPDSRELLARIAEQPIGNAELPFMAARELRLGYAPALALRVTYVGELGYELHLPTEYAAETYRALWAAGADLGVTDVGYRAIESLRLEKRYLYWGADLTPDYNPYEAGLGFCVALDKGDFNGRTALARIREEGVRRRLCCFTVDGYAPLFGGEAILREGRVVGVTTSAGYGHTLGESIAYGYLAVDECTDSGYEIEAFCERVAATRYTHTLYDPQRLRILA